MPLKQDITLNPLGFREYDMRWRYPDDINLEGIFHVGRALGQQLHLHQKTKIAVGHDFRSYSQDVKNALMAGLSEMGIEVLDIGLSLSPMLYFAQFCLGNIPGAMVTASHNPNGWTGLKTSINPPLTHGPDEMSELKHIALNTHITPKSGGSITPVKDIKAQYLDDLVGDFQLSRPLRVVCATGNGTAGDFAPELLNRIGAKVIERHTELDHRFPHYNPNPEALEMLHDMADVVQQTKADIALGFDGDGDRCGVVDHTGAEIFADKIGLLLARDYAKHFPAPHFVVDIKSTSLFENDPVLHAHGATVEYWKTGHSHMKRRVAQTGALAGFEKSGHYFIAPPLGHGYDCGLRVAVELLKLLDRHPDSTLHDLENALPQSYLSPSMSPFCADDTKYDVVQRLS
ncbi:MAG: phosphomannomutase/phosphoglucomutase, partial [Halocynthiibacter sp.]